MKEEHKLFSDLGTGGSGGSPYYDSSSGFPATSTTTDIYDTISTMSQAQSTHIYNPPIGTSIGEYNKNNCQVISYVFVNTPLHVIVS